MECICSECGKSFETEQKEVMCPDCVNDFFTKVAQGEGKKVESND